MKSEQAKSVLELLLSGVDPVTGECLDDEHVCLQPLVALAFRKAVEALEGRPAAGQKTRLPANRPWTDADDEQIRALHASGYSPEQICAVMDRRPRSLVRHMEYLGLVEGSAPVQGLERAGTPWRAQDEEELRALFASGIDADEIAAQMHRTRYSIACRLEKLGLIEDREQLRK